MFKTIGRPLVFFDGDKGGGGGNDPNQEDKDKKPTGGGTDKKEFTQEQLDKMFGDTRKQGRDSLQSEILEKAGFKTIDEMYAAMNAYRKSEEEKLSEVDKAKKDAEKAKAESDRLTGELRMMRFERDFNKTVNKLELEFQNDKAREVAFKLLDIEKAGKGEKEMEEAIKTLLDEHAYLFLETDAEEIDATSRGKPNKKILKKEIIESKRKSGKYSVI